MDGGGRYLQPMTAYPAGIAVARAASGSRGALRPSSKIPRESRSCSVPPAACAGAPPAFRSSSACRVSSAAASPSASSAVVIGFGLWQGGHIDGFIRDYGEPHHALARAVGLGLEQVTISGISQMGENEVLAAAGINSKLSLAFLDVNDLRERLERVPMVKSATVRKLYPNELVITLTEREAHAIWQNNGELFVIAADGTVIDLMQDERYLDLPFVVGEGANTRNKDYLALIEAAGPLKHRVRAGTLVAGRRWTLKMDNGMDVRLPELKAADALARLVKLENEQKILEKDVLAIDLRMADRVVVRLTEEAALARAEALKKKPMRGKGVDT